MFFHRRAGLVSSRTTQFAYLSVQPYCWNVYMGIPQVQRGVSLASIQNRQRYGVSVVVM